MLSEIQATFPDLLKGEKAHLTRGNTFHTLFKIKFEQRVEISSEGYELTSETHVPTSTETHTENHS